MFQRNDNPIDYREFKRRARWRAALRAYFAIAWFSVWLAFLFIGAMLLISFGSYYR